jgi:hypothetical protein
VSTNRADHHDPLPTTPRLDFTLTQSNLGEGGRERHQEAYLNVTAAHARYFGRDPFRTLTTTGVVMELRPSGGTAWANVKPGDAPTPKNLRSVPADVLGRWLASQSATPGDKVYLYRLEPDLWVMRHEGVDLRAEQQRSPEYFNWGDVFKAQEGGHTRAPDRSESQFYRGSGRRGAR